MLSIFKKIYIIKVNKLFFYYYLKTKIDIFKNLWIKNKSIWNNKEKNKYFNHLGDQEISYPQFIFSYQTNDIQGHYVLLCQ